MGLGLGYKVLGPGGKVLESTVLGLVDRVLELEGKVLGKVRGLVDRALALSC